MADLRKRLITAILGAVMIFAVVSCGDDSAPSESDTPQEVGS